MELKKIFDTWAHEAKPEYAQKQWLLSKWEMFDGLNWPPEKQDVMLNSIRQTLQLNQSDEFIELGCGGGWIFNILRQHVRRAHGMDISMEMLKYTRALKSESVFFCGEIGAIPIKPDSFNKVLCYYVFINFTENQYIERSLLEILRILKRGGRALIGQIPDVNGSAEYDRAKKEYSEFYRKKYDLGIDTSNIHPPPLKLYSREQLISFLKKQNAQFYFSKSFNPFYHEGQPELIDWRFDLILEKKL